MKDFGRALIKRCSPNAGESVGTVIVIGPGGLEHGGGIGRQMGYFLNASIGCPDRVRHRVVDSRGPSHVALSPIYFGLAILSVLIARLSHGPSLLHVNIAGRGSTMRKVILLLFSQMLLHRYVLHLHDYDYANDYRQRGSVMRMLVGVIFRRASAVVVLGRRDRQVISELLRVPEGRIVVLHNAVPDPGAPPDMTWRARQTCHLLFLGRLSARKGVGELLRALASPSVSRLSWRATLAGDGPLEEFRQLAEELGILERTSFPGWLDEAGVRGLCRDADVLVLPSHAEGLAMSVLEGLSHGLAVITTPVGAHLEVIEPGVSGILVPPGDEAALADALARVIADEALRRCLGKGARDRFLEKFDVRGYAARLEQLHSSLLESGRKAALRNRERRAT